MWGNVAVQNPATADLHDQQHVQDLEASRDRDQKVTGDDRLSVIVNKGPPMLRRSSPWTLAAGLPRPVGTYGSWCDTDPELHGFLGRYSGLTPGGIFRPHPTISRRMFSGNRGLPAR